MYIGCPASGLLPRLCRRMRTAERGTSLVEAFDCHAAIGSVQGRDDLRQRMDRVLNRAALNSCMSASLLAR
jgi:hypothetical protein